MRSLFLAGLLLALTGRAHADARACTTADYDRFQKEPDANGHSVLVDCSGTLPAGARITRALRFVGNAADGVVFDCNHAEVKSDEVPGNQMLRIESVLHQDANGDLIELPDHTYKVDRPENVTIKNCAVTGQVRIWGIGQHGQARYVRESSHEGEVHVTRVRLAAPTGIVLDNVDIVATGDAALYLGPGVTHVTLQNSLISGKTHGPDAAVYLDTESRSNTLRNNRFQVDTVDFTDKEGRLHRAREIVAIDGSSYNLIVDNYFSGLDHGGIYLFRNCGEVGTVRFTGPARNQILNNYFHYVSYTGMKPAIYIGARDYDGEETAADYCAADSGFDFGSGASNLDFARYNVVMQNQIAVRSVSDMIAVRGGSSTSGRSYASLNSPNYIAHNQTVSARITRQSGCYLPSGFRTSFMLDGASEPVIEKIDGQVSCAMKTCNDGVLDSTASCGFVSASFACSRSGSNEGCETGRSCPIATIDGISRQTYAFGAIAVCDLETGSVSTEELAAVPAGRLGVARKSDAEEDGSCYAASTAVISREDVIRGGNQQITVQAGCQEHDTNGGDCAVRGTLYCR
jgi:hypothetical protein